MKECYITCHSPPFLGNVISNIFHFGERRKLFLEKRNKNNVLIPLFPSLFLSTIFTYSLCSTYSYRITLHMKPFPSSVQKFYSFVIATSTKICTYIYSITFHKVYFYINIKNSYKERVNISHLSLSYIISFSRFSAIHFQG